MAQGHRGGRQLKRAQVEALWAEAWHAETGKWPTVSDTRKAADIAWSESKWWTDAENDSDGGAGLWQITPAQTGSFDPRTNARQAVRKALAAVSYGWDKWQPWTASQSVWAVRSGAPTTGANAHLQRVSLAGDLLKKFNPLTGGPPGPGDILGAGSDLLGKAGDAAGGIPVIGGPLEAAAEMARAISKLAAVVVQYSQKIADPRTWLDAGKIFLGIMLLYLGMKRIFRLA